MNEETIKEPFVKEVMDKLKEGIKEIKVKDQIRDRSYGQISIVSLSGSPLNPEMDINKVKFRFQHIISGANMFSEGSYRIDSHNNKPLHQHFMGNESPIENVSTLGDALAVVLGSQWTNYYRKDSSNN